MGLRTNDAQRETEDLRQYCLQQALELNKGAINAGGGALDAEMVVKASSVFERYILTGS